MVVITCLIVALVVNFLLFLIAYTRRSDKLTDFSYALSFIVGAITAVVVTGNWTFTTLFTTAAIIVWALRLGGFLVFRIRKTGKDTRFDGIREDFFAFLKFWLGQGLVAWVLLLPLLFMVQVQSNITEVVWLGGAVWLVGLLVEAIADAQKYNFTQNPTHKGKWIESGLWRYSRHPNYFGEICVWVGVYLMAFSSLGTVERVISLVSPIGIFVVLRFISGVPPLEKAADKRWGGSVAYREYKKRTPLLVPLPRRYKK